MPKEKFKNLFEYYGFTKKDEKEYPVVSSILKQLTPERIKKEAEAIQKVKLPPELQRWVREYEKVGERNRFVWKWLYRAEQATTLTTVSNSYKKLNYKLKFLIFMFDVLIDDVVDKMQNRDLLAQLLRIPFTTTGIGYEQLGTRERRYLDLIIKLWSLIQKEAEKLPRYKEFKEIFEFDLIQLFNALKYSNLVQKQYYLVNETESWIYLSHHMTTLVCYTVDLMSSSKFNIQELGIMREVAWEAQKMARISNWISTWEREIRENDLSSGIFFAALNFGIVTFHELKKGNKSEVIGKIRNSRIEENFLKEWENHYFKICKLGKKIRTVNISKVLSGITELLILYLVSRKII